jgi:hypothetical protein
MSTTAFVLVTDSNYFYKASVTVNDLRTVGKWFGDLVLITIDFNLDERYKIDNNIIEQKFSYIDKTNLLQKIGPNGFENSDKRELHKLNQWEKLHAFDDYFLKWDRVVFLDAGLRVLDDVKYILELDCKNKILAPIDGKQLTATPNDKFAFQLDHNDADKIANVINDFGENIFEQRHMLNCMWVYDTRILNICNKDQLIEAMNKYPICRTNEMGIMNLLFHFKYKLWERFPPIASNGKFLFEWCELNNNFHTTWQNYCFLKYPVTMSLNQHPH